MNEINPCIDAETINPAEWAATCEAYKTRLGILIKHGHFDSARHVIDELDQFLQSKSRKRKSPRKTRQEKLDTFLAQILKQRTADAFEAHNFIRVKDVLCKTKDDLAKNRRITLGHIAELMEAIDLLGIRTRKRRGERETV
ncbi:hypothetical protein [Rosistilla oblonga]|uniref:hypothetical protein n=1 Tax=Rosistilla oblonga TaxID=2527990 RepID=UPI003A980CC4